MFEYVLDCPQCNHRFHYEHDGSFLPAEISCPQCGITSPASEYYALILCNKCRSKLKMPLDMLNEEGHVCPKCGAEIQSDRYASLGDSGNTIADFAAAKSKKRMLQDGDFFDKFQIISLLGRGGMAEVYLAEHLLLKQKCALKLMQQTLDQEKNPVFIKRFIREAKLTHSLNHPNIVKVFDAGSDFKTGFLFLAMEYVEGQTLHDIINEQVLSESALIEILTVIASALKSLEEAKVVHRDIKPSNIMYTTEGVYKLMDLGIAKMESNHLAGDMTLTMEQSTIGTPGYASPEQCSAAHQVDIRSDIFSLGATIYHAASGFAPFTGDTPVAAILNTMQKEPEPLIKLRPDLSDDFINLIEKMMKKKPADRFQSIDEILEALAKIEKNGNTSAPVRQIKRIAAALTTGFSTVTRTSQKKSGRILFGILKTMFALLTVAVAAVHVYYVVSRLEDGTKTDYTTFMKRLFLRKNLSSAVYDAKDLPTLLNRWHPMISDPKHPKRRGSRLSGNRFPIVQVSELSYRSHSFDTQSNWKNIPPESVRKGMLDTSSQQSNKTISMPYLTDAISDSKTLVMNIRLHSNEDMGIVGFCALQLFIHRGTLRIVYNYSYHVDTDFTIPPQRWVNIVVSMDVRQGKIILLSEDRLIGSYLLPPPGGNIIGQISFTSHLVGPMRGEVDFLATSDKFLDFKMSSPPRWQPSAVYQNRIPDRLPHEYNKNVTPKTDKIAVTPSAPKFIAVTPSAPKSEALFPVFRPQRNNYFSSAQSVDAHLAKLRMEHREYSEAVQKLQESLKDMPSTIPPGIREKRRQIAETAANLCKRRESRLVYLEKRNRKINAAKNKQYSTVIGQKIKDEFARLVAAKQSNRAVNTYEFGQRILKLLTNPTADPNIEVQWFRDGKIVNQPIIAPVTSGGLLGSAGFEILQLLITRGVDPGPTVYPRYTWTWDKIISYGITGSNLNHFFSSTSNDKLRVLLFLDGAFPQSSTIFRALVLKDYDLLLFLLACGADPNVRDWDSEKETPLFKVYRMAEGEKFRELLMAAGADPAIRSASGKRASDFTEIGNFIQCWEKEDIPAIRKALQSKKVSPDLNLEHGYNLLESACQKGNIELVKLLLENGADIRKKGRYDQSAAWMCLEYIAPENRQNSDFEKAARILLLLLDKGADVAYTPGNRSREQSIMTGVLDNFRDPNPLIPYLVKYLPALKNDQWRYLMKEAIFYWSSRRKGFWRVGDKNRRPSETLTDANFKLIADKCPDDIILKNFGEFLQRSAIPPYLLTRAFSAGLDPNMKFTVRQETVKYPLLWHLIQKKTTTPEAIETALKHGADPRWRDSRGRSYEELTNNLRIKTLLKNSRRRR